VASIKRVLVCFNEENKSQNDLWQLLVKEFGTNLSGGVKNVLWSYFYGSLSRPQQPRIEIKQENLSSMESVL
jgi:hypothetical protein